VEFFFGFAAIAWGLGFLKLLDHPHLVSGSCSAACTYRVYVTFPLFPNVLDVLGMFVLGSYLLYEVVRRARP
jgi:hypothetical protein